MNNFITENSYAYDSTNGIYICTNCEKGFTTYAGYKEHLQTNYGCLIVREFKQ